MNEKLSELFKKREWNELVFSYNVRDLIDFFSFEDGLRLAYGLLYNDNWDESLQEYAVELLYQLRDKYPHDWNSSWRNDAFLGMACHITLKYDERYLAYKRAIEKAKSPPPELLIELARCFNSPGDPPLSRDEAISLLKQAIKESLYIEAIGLLCTIYWEKGDFKKENYWKNILKDLEEKNGKHSPSIEPEFLVNEYMKTIKDKEQRL